jgi:hypothetical protein
MDNVIKFTQKRKKVDGIFNLKINEKKNKREDEDSLWKIVRSALLLLAIQC